MQTYIKAPDKVLSVTVDWSKWPKFGEVIASTIWMATPADAFNVLKIASGTKRTALISGGLAGQELKLVCAIRSNFGRTAKRTFLISNQGEKQ